MSNGSEYKNILDNLNATEKEVALSILKEFSETGKSEVLEELINSDYKEIPVDIITFILDDRFLGRAWHDGEGKSKLFPYWERRLNELFPDPYTTLVNNAIISGARGLGKTEISVAIMLYLMYRVLCLKDPLGFYDMKPTEKIMFAFMNLTIEFAEKVGISKFQETVQLSPWFMNKGTMTRYNNKPYWIPPEPIVIIIGSQSGHVLGKPIFAAFFDEISFIKNKSISEQKEIAINMIDTAIGGMKTRFIRKGKNPTLLVLASSKRSEKSFLEEHMKKKLESEKDNVLIVDEAVWTVQPRERFSNKTFNVALGNKFLLSLVVKPEDNVEELKTRGYKIIEVPMDFYPNFIEDIDRGLIDYAGISSSEISKYISGAVVQRVVNQTLKNPFTKEIIEVGNAPDDTAEYKNFFDLSRVPQEMKQKPLYIHLDMSISGDMTGIGGVWIKGKKPSTDANNQSKDLFFSSAFVVSVKAPKGRQISFEKNRNFIYWLKEQGFNIKGISTDTFQSYDTGQALQAKGFNYSILSVDRVDTDRVNKPYQYLKSTIYEERIEIFNSENLIDELTDLERNLNTGRIDHAPNGKKDAADSLCGSLFNASRNAEQFAYEWGESLDTIASVNMNSGPVDRQQVIIDFEEELKALSPFAKLNEKQSTGGTVVGQQQPQSPPQQQQPDTSGLYIADGIIVW